MIFRFCRAAVPATCTSESDDEHGFQKPKKSARKTEESSHEPSKASGKVSYGSEVVRRAIMCCIFVSHFYRKQFHLRLGKGKKKAAEEAKGEAAKKKDVGKEAGASNEGKSTCALYVS